VVLAAFHESALTLLLYYYFFFLFEFPILLKLMPYLAWHKKESKINKGLAQTGFQKACERCISACARRQWVPHHYSHTKIFLNFFFFF
jgi:hypothetical protein